MDVLKYMSIPFSPFPCAGMFQRSVPNLVCNERLIENDSPSTLQMISVKYRTVLRSDLSAVVLNTREMCVKVMSLIKKN